MAIGNATTLETAPTEATKRDAIMTSPGRRPTIHSSKHYVGVHREDEKIENHTTHKTEPEIKVCVWLAEIWFCSCF